MDYGYHAGSLLYRGNFVATGKEAAIDLSVQGGPLNEGATYAERKGYHLPGGQLTRFPKKSPFQELPANGVGYYATRLDLNIPPGYDVPLSFVFKKCMLDGSLANFRVVLYVNGWQFGKYLNNIGPQTRFPVPEDI
ncbi:hypothetical protein N8T08_004707 [Aspergillus melleus]|uniref:Uncharacterized protein n=1 Tax=Aspergillus melleus TaxID=138277 RepID=A0ACC3B4Z0_9EURO|nr:hypothetical protein N8T08_004707 [Aspergillus melleus]